jgi:signal transduction histidine kinase
VISEVRMVAQNLRPLHIDELGLTTALDSLLNRIAESGALRIERRLENVDDVVHGESATHLYRIVQEAINNTIKHAHATFSRVQLERDIHCVRLSVNDDGKGFDVNNVRAHGLGLSSIAERCKMLSASFKLTSNVGLGTTINIEMPISESDEHTTTSEAVQAD